MSSGSPILVSFLRIPWIASTRYLASTGGFPTSASRVQGSVSRLQGRRPKLCDCRSHSVASLSERSSAVYVPDATTALSLVKRWSPRRKASTAGKVSFLDG